VSAAATDPHLFVVFGGLGDLGRRKILPALHLLAQQNRLGDRSQVLAVGRSTGITDADSRQVAREALEAAGIPDEDAARWCASCLHYQSIRKGAPDDFAALRRRIEAIEADSGLPGNRAFYLATVPGAFGPTVTGLGEAGLNRSRGFTRLVIEKPFGRDLETAVALNRTVHAQFAEEQVYRIDHYLGKETVQNLLVFRFGNAIFEDLWNRDRIESVTVTVAEDLGIEGRAAFYDGTGALRDVVQNHLMQILCLVAMEVPTAFEAHAVRHEKVKVLQTMAMRAPARVVFGRYGAGTSRGRPVPGYLQEKGVPADSTTETFVAMELMVDNWRWQGVPFYVRAGKRLPRKLTEVTVTFRRPPICMFESMGSCLLRSNVLRITLQPDEGFSMLIDVKAPGQPITLRRIPLGFRYEDAFGELPDAYETLLLDILRGDQTLFVDAEETEASWRVLDPLLRNPPEVQEYAAGTWGPQAAALGAALGSELE
jgi:glucose-6-phosphate 1-dehydrogenase